MQDLEVNLDDKTVGWDGLCHANVREGVWEGTVASKGGTEWRSESRPTKARRVLPWVIMCAEIYKSVLTIADKGKAGSMEGRWSKDKRQRVKQVATRSKDALPQPVAHLAFFSFTGRSG